jgi:hypothetical protein
MQTETIESTKDTSVDNTIQVEDSSPSGIKGLNLDQFRLNQDYITHAQVKKAITTVPINSPNRNKWYRVLDGKNYNFTAMTITYDRDTYVVSSSFHAELQCHIVPKVFYILVDRDGNIITWGIRLADHLGRLNDWSKSAFEAIAKGRSEWVQVAANMNLGAYDIYTAVSELEEPQFPDTSFEELLAIAFKGRTIDSLDHPIVKKIRGEI